MKVRHCGARDSARPAIHRVREGPVGDALREVDELDRGVDAHFDVLWQHRAVRAAEPVRFVLQTLLVLAVHVDAPDQHFFRSLHNCNSVLPAV
eukprot:2202762-Rhodomonas_salina.4